MKTAKTDQQAHIMENEQTKLADEATISINENAKTINEEAKKIGIVSYITILGLIVAFVMNNEKKLDFASYHIRQSIGLCVTGLALGIIGLVPILGWLINIVGAFVLFYMWVMALMNVINGKAKPAPILGEKYEEWFKGV